MFNPLILQSARQILNSFFKINGKSAGDLMSDGQVEIFAVIAFKLFKRIACVAPTGYGKSEAVAMGVIWRTFYYHEPFIIGSVKYDTSEIIMKKVIEHLFDSPLFVAQLEIDTTKRLTTLKRERNKQSINFKDGGAIKVISLFGTDSDVSTAIGVHVPNIILDESPLLTPSKYLAILKILEGTGSYDTTFLFELGNAVNRNHFMFNVKSNASYYHIDISLEQAIQEGRLDTKSIEEKRGLPFFDQFYECKFPEEDEIDEKGYRQLLTQDEINNAMIDELTIGSQPLTLGVDVGGGGDYNVYTLREENKHAWFKSKNRSNDTMVNVVEIERIIDEFTTQEEGKRSKKQLDDKNVYLDDIGVGRGPADRLKEKGLRVNGVSVGEKADDATRFKNKKAENYWRAREWVRQGGKLLRANEWYQLTWIKYKINSDKVLQIEPKEDLKQRMGKSPDFAESFMLTFSRREQEAGMRLL